MFCYSKTTAILYLDYRMTSLSEAYVNYCIEAEGLELDNSLAEVFSQERSITSSHIIWGILLQKLDDDIL